MNKFKLQPDTITTGVHTLCQNSLRINTLREIGPHLEHKTQFSLLSYRD